MQAVTDTERAFLQRRRRLIRWWPLALLCMLLLLAGTGLFLYLKHPALANASYVIASVADGTLSADIMQLSALFLPVVITMLFFVLAVMLLFLHLTIRNERRYQSIIRRLRQQVSGRSG